MADLATDRPDHWWHDRDGDGHNCTFCPDESIWKCDEAAHLQPSPQEQTFVRLVVERVEDFAHDLSPEMVVGMAYRLSDSLIHLDNGMALTDDNALRVAALIAVSGRTDSGRLTSIADSDAQ